RNRIFLEMLSAASSSPVIAAGSATGTSQGAALLAGPAQPPAQSEADAIHRETDARLTAYARAWRKALA
ncbi:MAG: carbohydrate kinase, partial [Maritimibacter sp.]